MTSVSFLAIIAKACSPKIMRLKIFLFIAIALVTAVYPFIVYNGLKQFSPAMLSWILLLLLTARVVLRGDYAKPEQYAQLVLVGGLCVFAALQDSEVLLRYYPVAMSLSFAGFFAVSLTSDKTLIERFAEMVGSDYEPHQRRYMRGLTVCWSILLVMNAVVSMYTACCLSLAQWAFYNGLIAYFVFGVFALLELVVRYFYRKKYQQSIDG